MGVAWGMDTIYTVRGLQQAYFILTDPLVIIAAALLLAQVPSLQAHKRAYQIGAVLITVHLVLSQSEPVKHTFQTSKPLFFCEGPFAYTKQIESYSFCPPVAQ
jgi:hypothetical protein